MYKEDLFAVYEKEVGRFSFLSEQELNSIDYVLGNGSTKKQKKQAREKLASAYLRIPLKIARKYKWKYNLDENDANEVLQICNLLYMKAVKYYNPDKGAKFLTYINNVIKTNIPRILGWQNSRRKKCFLILDKYIGEEEEETLGEVLENPKAEQPLNNVEQQNLEKTLHIALGEFKNKKREVMALKSEGFKLREIAVFMGITHQRVSMIHKEVIDKLKRGMKYQTA